MTMTRTFPSMKIILTILALILASVTDAFPILPFSTTARGSHSAAAAITTALHASSTIPPKQKVRTGETPTSAFGRPLSKATKDWNRSTIHSLKSFLFDNIFSGTTVDRAFARFYALETIARMPYFSYLSALHLMETLGHWRRAEYLKIHFSESWNEMHHLLIMEELGGNDRFADRFVAQHIAVFYYWIVLGLYFFNPTFAYNLNQAVEEEAYQTYNNFLTTNEDHLKDLPATNTAIEYYRDGDLYLFDEMHTAAAACEQGPRRPKIENLYDVFVAIRDDEMEHVKTMVQMQESDEHDTCAL